MRVGFFATAAMVAGAGSAVAAGPSFDCAGARNAHERLICADPALAKADADLAGTYRAALDRLGPDGRAALAATQRGRIAFTRAVCPLPYPKENRGASFSAAECLLGAYRERMAVLSGSVRHAGPFTVVRLDAYSVRRLGPDDPGGHYAGGLAVGEVSADWIEPSSVPGGGVEASRLDAALLPAELRPGRPRFTVKPKPVLDTDAMDTSLDVTIEGVTPLVVTTRAVDWSYGHGTPHG